MIIPAQSTKQATHLATGTGEQQLVNPSTFDNEEAKEELGEDEEEDGDEEPETPPPVLVLIFSSLQV